MAKGGGSANKTFLFQKTKALLNEKALEKVSRSWVPLSLLITPFASRGRQKNEAHASALSSRSSAGAVLVAATQQCHELDVAGLTLLRGVSDSVGCGENCL